MKYKRWKQVMASVLTAAILLRCAPVLTETVEAAEEPIELIAEMR